MRMTKAENLRAQLYRRDKSIDTLGDLHQRMRAVVALTQKARADGRTVPNDLEQAIYDLETEVSHSEPAKPPYGKRVLPACGRV